MSELELLARTTVRMVPVTHNTVTTDVLIAPQKVITIIHNSDHYTLRITGNNKLILTK